MNFFKKKAQGGIVLGFLYSVFDRPSATAQKLISFLPEAVQGLAFCLVEHGFHQIHLESRVLFLRYVVDRV